MEREELLQEVQSVITADGKQLSPSISEDTINAELDDELENIGDDAEANKKVYSRIAKRLLRIDGNIHSNVSREVTEYKKKLGKPKPNTPKPNENQNTEDSEELKLLKQLQSRIEGIEKSRKDKEDAEAKNAVIESVKKGLRDKFKTGNVDVNEYIYKQTLRDLELPELEEGKKHDIDGLVKKMETAYYKNLKEAGLDKKQTGRVHQGAPRSGGNAKSRLDEMFAKKSVREGWGKKEDK